MKNWGNKEGRQFFSRLAPLLAWLLVTWGCPSPEAPLSPAAQAFKKEVQQAIGLVAQDLVEPVAASNAPAINAVLARTMPASLKLCRACPFMLGVLDHQGDLLAVYPPKQDYSRRYADYKLVMQALKKGEICHGRLFLQDGSKLFTICSPLKKGAKVLGVIVLTTTDQEVKQRWGLSEEEFAAINFNN